MSYFQTKPIKKYVYKTKKSQLDSRCLITRGSYWALGTFTENSFVVKYRSTLLAVYLLRSGAAVSFGAGENLKKSSALLSGSGGACRLRLGAKLIGSSSGSHCLLSHLNYRGTAPSGQRVTLTSGHIVEPADKPFLGVSSCKSSKFFYKKKKVHVRGTAKNAVDHRNGGKGRGRKLPPGLIIFELFAYSSNASGPPCT